MAHDTGEETRTALLRATLEVAVPMWITKVRSLSWEEKQARAKICAQVVAEKGDIIQFKAKGTADAFNHLAEGLALAAFAPGGIKFLGCHWEAQ